MIENYRVDKILKVGSVISPTYDLNSVFYAEYHRVLEDLHRCCRIVLAGNLSSKPNYADALLPLKPQSFSLFLHNRYMTPLSYLPRSFGSIKRRPDVVYAKHLFENLAAFFRIQKPEVLYFFPHYPDSYHVKLYEELSTKVVVEFWEDQIEHMYEDMETSRVSRGYATLERYRGYKWMEFTIQRSDRIIVPTIVLKERLTRLGGVASRISVVPVCQDPIIQRDPTYVRKKHNITTEKVLLYVGSLVTYHDIRTLFFALEKVKSSKIILLIAGGGSNIVDKYKKLVTNENVKVVHLGRPKLCELEYYLSAADICLGIYQFVEPSGFFPATVIKYMLAGKAIIATDLPEIREMFKGLKAGLLVPQHSANELALAIEFLLENYEERIKLGSTARKIAENSYLWKHHTRALVSIFDSLR